MPIRSTRCCATVTDSSVMASFRIDDATEATGPWRAASASRAFASMKSRTSRSRSTARIGPAARASASSASTRLASPTVEAPMWPRSL